MKDCKTVLIIGPGESVKEVNERIVDKYISVSFSGNLNWFAEKNLYPSYWTFLDPNSAATVLNNIVNSKYKEEWIKGLKTNTEIIYNKFQGTEEFYKKGYTTRKGPNWNKGEFRNNILPTLSNYFKKTNILPETVNNTSYDSIYSNKETCPLVKHVIGNAKINTDKFTCYIIPTVVTLFKNVTKIISIGFGDFNSPRVGTGNSLGYEGYKKSYNLMKGKLKELLIHLDIELEFLNKNTYFKDIEWKK